MKSCRLILRETPYLSVIPRVISYSKYTMNGRKYDLFIKDYLLPAVMPPPSVQL